MSEAPFKQGDHLVATGLRKALLDAHEMLSNVESPLCSELLKALDECTNLLDTDLAKFFIRKPRTSETDAHSQEFGNAVSGWKLRVTALAYALKQRQSALERTLEEVESANKVIPDATGAVRLAIRDLVNSAVDDEVACPSRGKECFAQGKKSVG